MARGIRIKYLKQVKIIFLILAAFSSSFVIGDDKPQSDKFISGIQKKIEDTNAQISKMEPAVNDESAKSIGVSVNDMTDKLDALKNTKSLCLTLITAIQRQEALKKALDDFQKETTDLKTSGLSEKPPYKIAFLDSFYNESNTNIEKKETLGLAITNASQEIQNAKENLKKEEKNYREKKESFQSSNNQTEKNRNEFLLALAQIKKDNAKTALDYANLSYNITSLDLKLTQKKIEFLSGKIAMIRKNLVFSEKDILEHVTEIEKIEDETERQLQQSKNSLRANEARLADARERLDKARGESEIADRKAYLDASDAWLQSSSNQVEMLEEKLSNLSTEKMFWDRRYSILNNKKNREYAQWKIDILNANDTFQRKRQIVESRILDVKSYISDIEKKLGNWDNSFGNKSNAESKLKALKKSDEYLNQRLSSIIAIQRFGKMLLNQLQEEQKHITFGDIIEWVRSTAVSVWKLELFIVGDRSITLSKVFIAIFVLIAGMVSAKYLTRSIKKQALTRMRTDESGAKALERIAYYFLVIIILILSFHIVNIPLTIFTFFGGAAAIAIGFGAQNLLNNFISGLIIMFERPIKINDIIQVENSYGRVMDIGTRCTLIRLNTGIDVLVPNSSIIEKSVTNLTFSDNNLQLSVSIGVAYGSIPKDVERIIKKAVNEDKRVLKHPEPLVLFTNFGENSLDFEVLFWIQITQLVDSRVVRSDLRFRLEELLREEGINIAFPQRDLHIDTYKPLEIKMVSPENK